MPLAEVIIDFFDRLKSTTKGYASIEYNITNFKASNLIKLDVLLNNDVVDALSIIIHKDFAMSRGREVAKNLQKLIPRLVDVGLLLNDPKLTEIIMNNY